MGAGARHVPCGVRQSTPLLQSDGVSDRSLVALDFFQGETGEGEELTSEETEDLKNK